MASSHRVNIGAFKARFGGKVAKLKKGVMIKLFAATIKDTPVLSGRLRGNWTFSKGNPLSATGEPTEDPTGKVVSQVNEQVDETDENYYLANSMPYAHRIEYEGWSHTKAPQGMVRKNLVRIVGLLKQNNRNPTRWHTGNNLGQ